jgi:hypothetical protein
VESMHGYFCMDGLYLMKEKKGVIELFAEGKS